MSASLHSYYSSPIDSTNRPCIYRLCGPMRRSSLRRATLLLVFSILNPSCIVLPMILNTSSLLEIFSVNFLGFIVTLISLQHLSSACCKSQIFDYYNLIYNTTNRPWRTIIAICMILHWLFLVASYMSLFNYFVPNIYKPLKLDLNANEEKMYTLILANIFITLPLTLFKDFEHMAFTKISNAIGVAFIITVSFYDLFFYFKDVNFSLVPKTIKESSSLACIFSVYTGYHYLPTLEYELFEPTDPRIKKILVRSLVPISLVYIIISLSPFIYLSGADKYWATISEEMMIIINLIILIPTNIMTLKGIAFDVIDYQPKAFVSFCSSVGFTVSACCIAIFFDQVVVLFSVCGVLNCVLMVVVPGKKYAVFINDDWSRWKKIVAWIYCLSVLGVAVFGLQASIKSR